MGRAGFSLLARLPQTALRLLDDNEAISGTNGDDEIIQCAAVDVAWLECRNEELMPYINLTSCLTVSKSGDKDAAGGDGLLTWPCGPYYVKGR